MAHTTPSMITANRKMPAGAGKGNDRVEPLYPYNTKAAGYAAGKAWIIKEWNKYGRNHQGRILGW